jgi:hypothetical protein
MNNERLFAKAVEVIRTMSKYVPADYIRPLSEEPYSGPATISREQALLEAKGIAVWQAREAFVGLFAGEDGFSVDRFRLACKVK